MGQVSPPPLRAARQGCYIRDIISETTMANTSDTILRKVLGTTLQTGALRAVVLLGAFTFVGAFLAWLIR
jgi:hypothetical protein